MKNKKSGDILSFIGNIIQEKTQVEGDSIYLTVSKIFKLTTKGEIDFAGSEYKESEREIIEPVKRSSEDKYGWWELNLGEYFIEFNEKLQDIIPKDKTVVLQPSERLIGNGAFHPTRVLNKRGKISTILCVGKNGLKIKENARVSRLFVLD
jgi:hypothetical protein